MKGKKAQKKEVENERKKWKEGNEGDKKWR